ncbi:MAG: hypothetical protein JW953_10840 [Anaerolineae bacterium]|nr:hypothetical protein [Anaerolineae bacterium]
MYNPSGKEIGLERQNGKALPSCRSDSPEAEALLTLIDASVHELNQPMTVILGLSELLLAQTDPKSPAAADLSIIVQEMQRMNEVVRGLKLLSHYQTRSQISIKM